MRLPFARFGDFLEQSARRAAGDLWPKPIAETVMPAAAIRAANSRKIARPGDAVGQQNGVLQIGRGVLQ